MAGEARKAPTEQPAADPQAGLLAELDAARARVQRLEEENAELRRAAGRPARQAPKRPRFGMSEGERQELIDRGVTVDPFTGEERNAVDEDVEPGNDAAKEAAEKARARAGKRPHGGAGSTEPSEPKK